MLAKLCRFSVWQRQISDENFIVDGEWFVMNENTVEAHCEKRKCPIEEVSFKVTFAFKFMIYRWLNSHEV